MKRRRNPFLRKKASICRLTREVKNLGRSKGRNYTVKCAFHRQCG